jgi:hypothetical protein
LTIRVADREGGIADTDIRVVGPGGELIARTDRNGVAKFDGIKAGRYRVITEGTRFHLISPGDDDVQALPGSCPSLLMGFR